MALRIGVGVVIMMVILVAKVVHDELVRSIVAILRLLGEEAD